MNNTELLEWSINNHIDICNYKYEDGTINFTGLQECKDMTERQKYLKKHTNTITRTKDGRYTTRIKDQETGKSKQITKKNLIDLENAIIDSLKVKEVNPTLKELFTKALERKLNREQIQRNTYFRYKEMYDKYISDFGNNRIKDLSLDDFVNYIENTFYTNHLDKKAYEKMRTILSLILQEAFRDKLITYTFQQITICLNISKKDISKNKKPDKPQVYTQDEQKKIKEFCESSTDIRDKGILLEMACGFRQGELVALSWSDYKGKYITVNGQERRERDADGKYIVYVEKGAGKTANAIRKIPLTPLAIRTLEALKETATDTDGFIFVYPNGNRIQSQAIYKRLKTVCKTLGIEYKSPHKLRKTFLSECSNTGMPVQTTQKIAGHADSKTTTEYYIFNTLAEDAIAQYYERSEMLQ